jgi:hypothetical protein
LFGPVQDHTRSQHYENEEAVQPTVREWLENTEANLYQNDTFKLEQRWQKCLHRSGDFVEK